jgi:hypothetical protein
MTGVVVCNAGGCARPAMARYHEGLVLCALHTLRREVGEEIDEAVLALDLLEGWHSVAKLHHNGYLIRMLDVAAEELRDRLAEAERRAAQIERANLETAPHGEPEG